MPFFFTIFLINCWSSVVASVVLPQLCNLHCPKVHSRKGLRSGFLKLLPFPPHKPNYPPLERRGVGLDYHLRSHNPLYTKTVIFFEGAFF